MSYNYVKFRRFPFRLFFGAFLFIFGISSFFIYTYSFSDQPNPAWLAKESGIRNLEDFDDYDAACSGYSVGRILREQKRVLESVRLELSESQVKLQEIRSVQDELQRLIPQKQLELSSLEGEIEAAQRELEELRENQNVRVFLPFSPIEQKRPNNERKFPSRQITSLDDVVDYSRCSISSNMPINIESLTNGEAEKQWEEAFREVVPNLVDGSENACFTIAITNSSFDTKSAETRISNKIVFNIGSPIISGNSRVIFAQNYVKRSFDFAISLKISKISSSPILPFSRHVFMTLFMPDDSEIVDLDFSGIENSASIVGDKMEVVKCTGISCLEKSIASSLFCIIPASSSFLDIFAKSLNVGCVPIIVANDQKLPFENFIDWRLATYRIPVQRLPEMHFILKSLEMTDVLEMRRMGRNYFENYLATKEIVARSVVSALRFMLQVPTIEKREMNHAIPLFNNSYSSPKTSVVNAQPNFDDEYLLGPIESRIGSPSYLHNFSEFQLYSYDTWNRVFSPHRTKEYLINSFDPPAESEFYPDSRFAFRPIDPGSGVEFSRALGGNRIREQFTIIMITYERDTVLVGALERLHQLPYLNKIIVIWNNINRDPLDTWPNLHVPIEFIKVSKNSLNNRFIPWNRIETEAVLSLDDDIDLMQQEIVFAFRVWRENRDRIVGFPARYHARYGDSMFYNSNHTCQMSIILTGAAFLHKGYLNSYTNQMPSSIREHVDKVMNCEDIAMNFLVSHLTRKPPIKTTSRWTLKCATCTERLSESNSHFEKRHECIRLFTESYGYNPLKFSQFRADSILFKTRLPQNHQKCFKYV